LRLMIPKLNPIYLKKLKVINRNWSLKSKFRTIKRQNPSQKNQRKRNNQFHLMTLKLRPTKM
jgi:hypothetical protein